METTKYPADVCLGTSLYGAIPSDHNENDAAVESMNSFMDSLVFGDEEASEDYRANVSNNHSNEVTATVANSSDDANNNNDANK